jgi:hypothetical protein
LLEILFYLIFEQNASFLEKLLRLIWIEQNLVVFQGNGYLFAILIKGIALIVKLSYRDSRCDLEK